LHIQGVAPRAFLGSHEPNLKASFSLTSLRASLNNNDDKPALEASLVAVTAEVRVCGAKSRAEKDALFASF
jgi:hypothetical protein